MTPSVTQDECDLEVWRQSLNAVAMLQLPDPAMGSMVNTALRLITKKIQGA